MLFRSKWLRWAIRERRYSAIHLFQYSINIFVWGVAMACHAACTNFGGLLACRFVLGICEGSVTPGFMVVTSMFYTRKEQTLRVGYWCSTLSFDFPCTMLMMHMLPVMMNGTGELSSSDSGRADVVTGLFSPDHPWIC